MHYAHAGVVTRGYFLYIPLVGVLTRDMIHVYAGVVTREIYLCIFLWPGCFLEIWACSSDPFQPTEGDGGSRHEQCSASHRGLHHNDPRDGPSGTLHRIMKEEDIQAACDHHAHQRPETQGKGPVSEEPGRGGQGDPSCADVEARELQWILRIARLITGRREGGTLVWLSTIRYPYTRPWVAQPEEVAFVYICICTCMGTASRGGSFCIVLWQRSPLPDMHTHVSG